MNCIFVGMFFLFIGSLFPLSCIFTACVILGFTAYFMKIALTKQNVYTSQIQKMQLSRFVCFLSDKFLGQDFYTNANMVRWKTNDFFFQCAQYFPKRVCIFGPEIVQNENHLLINIFLRSDFFEKLVWKRNLRTAHRTGERKFVYIWKSRISKIEKCIFKLGTSTGEFSKNLKTASGSNNSVECFVVA